MTLLMLLSLPFVASVVAVVLPTYARTAAAILTALVALVGFVKMALLYPALAGGAVVQQELRWIPSAGINFVLRVDGLAWMFALLVLGIGFLVAVYARYYMAKDEHIPPFVIFTDATLWEMARLQPVTLQDMEGIKGVGNFKLHKYGQQFILAIEEFKSNQR